MNSSAYRREQGLKTVAARGLVNGRGPHGIISNADMPVGGMEERSSGSFSNPAPGVNQTEPDVGSGRNPVQTPGVYG